MSGPKGVGGGGSAAATQTTQATPAPKKKCPEKTGRLTVGSKKEITVQGVFSEDPQCYSIFHPADPRDGLIDKQRILIEHLSDGRIKAREVDPLVQEEDLPKGAVEPTMEDIQTLVQYPTLSMRGYRWIGRSRYLTVEEPYHWYAVKERRGKVGLIAFFNDYNQLVHGTKRFQNQNGFPKMTLGEVKGLLQCEPLNLGSDELVCKPGACIKPDEGEKGTGTYFFVERAGRLRSRTPEVSPGILDVLKKKKADGSYAYPLKGWTDARREALIAYLEGIYEISNLGIQSTQTNIGSAEEQKWTSRIIVGAFVGMLYFSWRADRRSKRLEEQNQELKSDRAQTDGSDLELKDLVENVFDKAMEEYKQTGTFAQPYIDTDGKLAEIIDIIKRPQADMNNYRSVGPSRSGKTASSLRGLAQAWVIGQMSADERAVFFEKTCSMLAQQEAEVFVAGMERAAMELQTAIQEIGAKGFVEYHLSMNQFQGKGAVWVKKDAKLFAEKLMEPLMEMANEKIKVVLFVDEVHMTNDGDLNRGLVSMRDRLKELAEAHPFISLGMATTIDELKETLGKDPATLNRSDRVFHETAHPDKTVSILVLKPYAGNRYGLERMEMDALRAIYLLAQRVKAAPSAHTSAELYFNMVLEAAKDAGVKQLTSDFVFEHYDRAHAKKLGPRGLTAENLHEVFAYEIDEIERENKRDRAELDLIETELAGAKRVKPRWWTEEAGLGVKEGADVLSEKAEAEKLIAQGEEHAALVRRFLERNEALRSLFVGLSEAERGNMALDLSRSWRALSVGERAAIWAEGGLYGVTMGRDPLPPHWAMRKMAGRTSGAAAVGADKAVTEREREREPDPEREAEKKRTGEAEKEKKPGSEIIDPKKGKVGK